LQQYRGTDERQDRDWQDTLRNRDRGGWTGNFGAGASGGGSSEDLYGRSQDTWGRGQATADYRGGADTDWASGLGLPLALGAGAALLGGWLLGRSSHTTRHQEYRGGAQFQPSGRWESHSSGNRSVEIDETSDLIASSKVEGTAVYNRNGEKLGSVYNFMVGKRSGRVAYAVLTFGGLLGLGESYYPLPWNALTYDTELGGYVVGINKSQLKNAPSYAAGQDPFSNPSYRARINEYWGRG
jgi:hypothetical protein